MNALSLWMELKQKQICYKNMWIIYLQKTRKYTKLIYLKIPYFPKTLFFFFAKILNQIICIYIENKIKCKL